MAETRKFLSVETVSLLVAFAILAFAGLVTVQTEQDRRQSSAWVRHTLEVESALYRLDGAIRRAESEQRGYMVTRDPSYLMSKEALPRRLEKDLSELGSLVADSAPQAERLSKLREMLRERVDEFRQKYELMEAGRFDEAADILRGGEGKRLSDRIDAMIDQMVAHEEMLYRQRNEELTQATASLQTAIGSMIVLIAGVAGFAVLVIEKQMNALRKSRDSLKGAYNELISESTRRGSLEAQLRQSQKLEALGQLAGGIAHDFNNMLSVIVASLNILRRKLKRNEGGADELISSALDGADRAAALTHRLLAFSRIQPVDPQPLDANALVLGMSSILHSTLGAHVDVATVLAKDLWLTRVDANELESAILNLAVNARDAMPNGGQLTIETANLEFGEDHVEENPDAKPGKYVLIAMSDTGEGMPPDVVEKAFDPFFTTKPIGKGTGLGLSQAHSFVTQSGGRIKICSKVGRGTCVKLFLPCYVKDKAIAPPTREPPPQEEFPHGKPEEIVLLVEDDESARRVTAQGIRELGYTVLEAGSGRQAIEIIRGRPDISLLITDVVMPEMDGARLAREAVFRRHALHVMFITGYSQHAFVRNGMLDPDVNLLTKPFTLAQLAKKIRAVLDARGDLPKGAT